MRRPTLNKPHLIARKRKLLHPESAEVFEWNMLTTLPTICSTLETTSLWGELHSIHFARWSKALRRSIDRLSRIADMLEARSL
jgi:hypothetical protein